MANIMEELLEWLNVTPTKKMVKQTVAVGLAGAVCAATAVQFWALLILAIRNASALFCIAWICRYSGLLDPNSIALLMCNVVITVGCTMSAAILNFLPDALGKLRAQGATGQFYFGISLLVISLLL